MKKMKQLILLTLCVFTLFGMTACAGKDKTDNAADQTTTDKDRDNVDTQVMLHGIHL